MATCTIHPGTPLICPKCSASERGKITAKRLTKKARSNRAKLAAKSRWAGTTKAQRSSFAKEKLVPGRAAQRQQEGESQ